MSGWLDEAAVLEPTKIVLPRSSGRASASRTQRNALRTSVCQKTENVSQVWRRVGRCGPVAPALSTRTRGRSRSITRAAVTGSVASPATVSTRPFTSRASAASAPGSRATATTRMPAPASASTMPRPKPRLPPVTTAVWSRRSSTAVLHPRVAAVDEEAAARAARLAVPAPERAADELDALGIVLGPAAVLGDQDRHAGRHLSGAADGRLQRLGPELVAHLRQAHAFLGPEHARGAEARARVALHAEEVVPVR